MPKQRLSSGAVRAGTSLTARGSLRSRGTAWAAPIGRCPTSFSAAARRARAGCCRVAEHEDRAVSPSAIGDWVSGLSAVSARTTPRASRWSCHCSRSVRLGHDEAGVVETVDVLGEQPPALVSWWCSTIMSCPASSASSLPTPPGWGTSILKRTPNTFSYQGTLASTSVTVRARWWSRADVVVDMVLLGGLVRLEQWLGPVGASTSGSV